MKSCSSWMRQLYFKEHNLHSCSKLGPGCRDPIGNPEAIPTERGFRLLAKGLIAEYTWNKGLTTQDGSPNSWVREGLVYLVRSFRNIQGILDTLRITILSWLGTLLWRRKQQACARGQLRRQTPPVAPGTESLLWEKGSLCVWHMSLQTACH